MFARPYGQRTQHTSEQGRDFPSDPVREHGLLVEVCLLSERRLVVDFAEGTK
jgi:hypothetical protein